MIQVSALTHAMRPLVRDGLVEVRVDARDRRSKHVILSGSGKARLQEMCDRWNEANQRFEAILGAEAAETLRRLADRVASPEFLEAFANAVPKNGNTK